MSFAEKVITFYENLEVPKALPEGIEVLFPFQNKEVIEFSRSFYRSYYNDSIPRIYLIGINPGRLGAGKTGIPFTDPIRLEKELKIKSNLDKKAELSSRFIYDVIHSFGGPRSFFSNFYFTSVSPLGFIKDGKNINYYDQKDLEISLEEYIHDQLTKQLELLPSNRMIAFSLGRGKNHKYLENINKKHHYFSKIIPLPHPRWVMQYRLKRKDEFVLEYFKALESAVSASNF